MDPKNIKCNEQGCTCVAGECKCGDGACTRPICSCSDCTCATKRK